jgi:hypothetical protein
MDHIGLGFRIDAALKIASIDAILDAAFGGSNEDHRKSG